MNLKINREWVKPNGSLLFRGVYELEHVRYRDVSRKDLGLEANFGKWEEENLVVAEGINRIFDVMFHADTQVTTWYLGLISGATAPIDGDTLASHGFTEYKNYTGDRKEWIEGAASNKVIETATPSQRAEFDFTETIEITGGLLCSVETGDVGTLFSAALFTTSRTLNDGDTLRLNYKLTGSST